jgi:hypothetical protein
MDNSDIGTTTWPSTQDRFSGNEDSDGETPSVIVRDVTRIKVI